MNDTARAIALERLSEAQAEAMRIQLALDWIGAAITRAEEAHDGPAMARWYAREAELLHRRTEVADHVAAIAAVLWIPNEPPLSEASSLHIVH